MNLTRATALLPGRGAGSFALAVAVALALSLVAVLLSGVGLLASFVPPAVSEQPSPAPEQPRLPSVRLGILLHKRERGPNLPHAVNRATLTL